MLVNNQCRRTFFLSKFKTPRLHSLVKLAHYQRYVQKYFKSAFSLRFRLHNSQSVSVTFCGIFCQRMIFGYNLFQSKFFARHEPNKTTKVDIILLHYFPIIRIFLNFNIRIAVAGRRDWLQHVYPRIHLTQKCDFSFKFGKCSKLIYEFS